MLCCLYYFLSVSAHFEDLCRLCTNYVCKCVCVACHCVFCALFKKIFKCSLSFLSFFLFCCCLSCLLLQLLLSSLLLLLLLQRVHHQQHQQSSFIKSSCLISAASLYSSECVTVCPACALLFPWCNTQSASATWVQVQHKALLLFLWTDVNVIPSTVF